MVSRKKLLVVDDSDFSRKVIEEFLDSLPYEIFQAQNSVEALEIAAKHNIQIALVDLVMPDQNGMELTTELLRIYPEMSVIIMSSLNQERLILESIQRGAYEYLHKPFEKKQLVQILETL